MPPHENIISSPGPGSPLTDVHCATARGERRTKYLYHTLRVPTHSASKSSRSLQSPLKMTKRKDVDRL